VFNNKAALRLLATVQNVFVITDYDGLDPETSNESGTVYTLYFRPRIYSLGINLDF
jgi:iron complex outermembrane receptor protein